MEYQYTFETGEPNIAYIDPITNNVIGGIIFDIENGLMLNKDVRYVKYYEDTNIIGVYFDELLSVSDEAKLDQILENNKQKPEIKPVKISRYIDNRIHFSLYDYNILGLKKEGFFTKGELTTIKYWANWDATNGYTDLVLEETNTYNRDQYSYIQTRDKVIVWYNEDGTEGFTKVTQKKYSMAEAADAGEHARENVMTEVKINVVGMIAMTEQITIAQAEQLGGQFLLPLTDQINLYIQGVREPILSAITNGTADWLDNNIGTGTIRQYLYSSFSQG